MPFLALNGIDLFYDDHPGPSDDAPVIVFLHGAGGNHLSWWQQVPHFRKQYRCVTIDHRSYGASTDPKDEGWARYGEDLVGLLDHLGLDRVALVAQSMGGRTALDTAVRVPDRISAVVMADTWGFFQWPENLDRDVRLREPLMADRVERGLPVMVAESFPERDPERMFLYQQMQALNAPLDQRSMDKKPAHRGSHQGRGGGPDRPHPLPGGDRRYRGVAPKLCAPRMRSFRVLSTARSRAADTRPTGKTLRPSTPWWASSWRPIRSGAVPAVPDEWSAFVRPTGQTETRGACAIWAHCWLAHTQAHG